MYESYSYITVLSESSAVGDTVPATVSSPDITPYVDISGVNGVIGLITLIFASNTGTSLSDTSPSLSVIPSVIFCEKTVCAGLCFDTYPLAMLLLASISRLISFMLPSLSIYLTG